MNQERISGGWNDPSTRAKLVRGLSAVAAARVENARIRLAACLIVAIVAAMFVGSPGAIYWYAGLIAAVLTDRALHKRLLKRCEADDPPRTIWRLTAWTALQSIYGNAIAAILWFAPDVAGETLAVIYLCGGLANAAATLRSSPLLSLAGVAPTVGFLLGLPVAEFLWEGADNPSYLVPLIGGFLLLGFASSLWRSLTASDVAHAQAEEAAVRERRAAAAAAAAKTDMVRRMNDELRTPMTALIGAAEHLRRTAVTPQARAHIATLVQAGEVLKLVLSDLSDLDRLENGQVRIELAPSDPRELLRGVMSAFRAEAQDKNLELFLDVAPNVPRSVEIDPLRVRQVLFNLLANAVRYTTHGGVRVQLSALPGHDKTRARLRFVITDTGAGMSRSQLAQIFGRERYPAEGEGPGLGLAISIRLARLMGGHLAAKSELGQGSVFCFTLDARVLARAPQRARNSASFFDSAAPSRVSHSHTTSVDQPAAESASSAAASRARLRSNFARQ